MIPHLNSFAILTPVPRSLRSGAGPLPRYSPRSVRPVASALLGLGRRSFGLAASYLLAPRPGRATARFSVPPRYLRPGAPTPGPRGGGASPGPDNFEPRSLGRGPLPRYPRSLCSARYARLAFEALQNSQLASPTQKTNHWSVGRSVGEHMRSLKPVSPFWVLLQGVVTANMSRPKILRSVFMPPKFARANAQ